MVTQRMVLQPMCRFKGRNDLHVGAEQEEADKVTGLNPAEP